MKEEQKDTSRDYRNEAEQAHVININNIITGLLVIFSSKAIDSYVHRVKHKTACYSTENMFVCIDRMKDI